MFRIHPCFSFVAGLRVVVVVVFVGLPSVHLRDFLRHQSCSHLLASCEKLRIFQPATCRHCIFAYPFLKVGYRFLGEAEMPVTELGLRFWQHCVKYDGQQDKEGGTDERRVMLLRSMSVLCRSVHLAHPFIPLSRIITCRVHNLVTRIDPTAGQTPYVN